MSLVLPDGYWSWSIEKQQNFWLQTAEQQGLTLNFLPNSTAATTPTSTNSNTGGNSGNSGSSPLSSLTSLGSIGLQALSTNKLSQGQNKANADNLAAKADAAAAAAADKATQKASTTATNEINTADRSVSKVESLSDSLDQSQSRLTTQTQIAANQTALINKSFDSTIDTEKAVIAAQNQQKLTYLEQKNAGSEVWSEEDQKAWDAADAKSDVSQINPNDIPNYQALFDQKEQQIGGLQTNVITAQSDVTSIQNQLDRAKGQADAALDVVTEDPNITKLGLGSQVTALQSKATDLDVPDSETEQIPNTSDEYAGEWTVTSPNNGSWSNWEPTNPNNSHPDVPAAPADPTDSDAAVSATSPAKASLGLVGLGGDVYGLIMAIKSGSIAGAAAAGAALYPIMKLISSGGNIAANIPILGKIMGFMVAHTLYSTLIIAGIAILIGLLLKRENKAEQQIDVMAGLTVWSSGSVLTLASAAAFMTMGYNINTPTSSLSGNNMVIPVSTLKQALASGLSNADGSAYTGALPYNTPIVIKGGAPDGADQVLLIQQSGIQNGQAVDQVTTYNLANNMTFSKPSATSGTAGQIGAYIPFFINGQVNPQAIASQSTQKTLLAATPALTAASQTSATTAAGAANKSGINVNTPGD